MAWGRKGKLIDVYVGSGCNRLIGTGRDRRIRSRRMGFIREGDLEMELKPGLCSEWRTGHTAEEQSLVEF